MLREIRPSFEVVKDGRIFTSFQVPREGGVERGETVGNMMSETF